MIDIMRPTRIIRQTSFYGSRDKTESFAKMVTTDIK
jgi:hypothetical protein